jgi:hypothetical protein
VLEVTVINFKWGIIAALGAFLISVLMGLVSGVSFFHLIMRALLFTTLFFGLGFGLRFVINSYFPELLTMDESSANESFGQAGFEQSGQNASITIDNIGEYAVPELYKAPNDPNEMGNIEDLIAGIFNNRNKERVRPKASVKGVDVNKEAGYNNGGIQELSIDIPEEVPFLDDDEEEVSPVLEDTRVKTPAFTPSFGNDDEGLGGLPDLDMMARAFSSAYSSPAGFTPAPGPSPALASSLPSMPSAPVEMPSAVEEVEQPTRYRGNKPEPLKGDFNPKELAEGLRAVLNNDK